jgi:hypothetical protein
MKTITRRALIVITSLVTIVLGSLAQAVTPQQWATMLLMGAGKSGGGAAPTFNATANPAHVNASFTSPVTFSGVNTGTGMVVITVQYQSGASAHTTSGVKLNGTPMALAVSSTAPSTNGTAEVWYLGSQVANASSAVEFTMAAGSTYGEIGMQASVLTNVTTAPTATAFSAFASPASPYTVGPITIPTNGYGIASIWFDTGIGAITPGTGVTIDYQTNSLYEGVLAHMGPGGGSQTVSITDGNFQGFAAAFVAWGP